MARDWDPPPFWKTELNAIYLEDSMGCTAWDPSTPSLYL